MLFLRIALIAILSLSAYAKDKVILIEAERIPTEKEESVQKVHVIENEELDVLKNLDLSQILASFPQIYSVTKGATGQQSTLLIRGMDSYHTTVVIDGTIANDPTNPNRAFDFSKLDIENIERIEILKGTQSQLYGANSLGGVIYIKTKKAKSASWTSNLAAKSAYTNRHFANQNANFSLGKKFDRLGVHLNGGYAHAGAQSALIKRTNQNEEIDTAVERNLSTKINYEINNDNEVEINLKYLHQNTEYDDNYTNNPSSNERLVYEENLASASQKLKLSENWNIDYQFSHFKNRRLLPNSTRMNYKGLDQKGFVNLGNEFRTNYFLNYTLDFNYSELNFDEGTGVTKKDNFGKSLGLELKKSADDDLDFFYTIGSRFEDNQYQNNNYTFRTLLGKNLENDTVKLSFSRGINHPSLYTLFGYGGNPGIKPEVAYQGEASYQTKLSRESVFDITYFKTYFKEKFQYNSANNQMQNIGGANIEGFENSLSFQGSHEKISADVSFLKAEARKSNKKLAYRPAMLMHFNYDRSLNDITNAGFNITGVGKQYDSNGEQRERYFLTDIFLKHIFNYSEIQKLTTYFNVLNILNRGYIIEKNYSRSGRTFEARASLDF